MICSVRRSQKSSRGTLRGEKGKKKNPNPNYTARPDCGRISDMLSLSMAIPYKEENHYQREAQPVGKACATHMYPQHVSLLTCPFTQHRNMLNVQLQRLPPQGRQHLYVQRKKHVGLGPAPRPPHAASCFQSWGKGNDPEETTQDIIPWVHSCGQLGKKKNSNQQTKLSWQKLGRSDHYTDRKNAFPFSGGGAV